MTTVTTQADAEAALALGEARGSDTAIGARPVSHPSVIELELERTRERMARPQVAADGMFRRGGDLSLTTVERDTGAVEPGDLSAATPPEPPSGAPKPGPAPKAPRKA